MSWFSQHNKQNSPPPVPEPEAIPPIAVTEDPAIPIPEDLPEDTPEPAPEEPEIHEDPFVEKQTYRDAVQSVAAMEAVLKKSQGMMDTVNDVKNEADAKLEEWRSALEDVERKLLYVDKVLFK